MDLNFLHTCGPFKRRLNPDLRGRPGHLQDLPLSSRVLGRRLGIPGHLLLTHPFPSRIPLIKSLNLQGGEGGLDREVTVQVHPCHLEEALASVTEDVHGLPLSADRLNLSRVDINQRARLDRDG